MHFAAVTAGNHQRAIRRQREGVGSFPPAPLLSRRDFQPTERAVLTQRDHGASIRQQRHARNLGAVRGDIPNLFSRRQGPEANTPGVAWWVGFDESAQSWIP